MFKLFYEKRKGKTGSYFDVIYVDLGYRTMFLCFDRPSIAEILGKSVADLFSVDPDTKIEIGEIDGSALELK